MAAMVGLGKDVADEPDWNEAAFERSWLPLGADG